MPRTHKARHISSRVARADPEAIWSLPAARVSLQHDLAAAGVTGIRYRWSLVPAATERDLLSMLPAVALFFAAATLGLKHLRRLLRVVIGLAMFSLLLAIAQLETGQSSILNPYPQWVPDMNGIFANHNHQATMLAIALLLSVAFLADARWREQHGDNRRSLAWVYAVLIAVFVIAIPLIGSRAGPIIAIVPTVAFVAVCPLLSLERLRRHRLTQLGFVIAAIALLVGVYSARRWTQGEDVDVIRFAKQTTALGVAHAPLGGGIGGFMPLYHQGVDASELQESYVNNAHNEYAQIWLEGGVLGLVGLVAVFIVLALSVRRLMRFPARSTARTTGLSAVTALLVVILHSWVDYPLRTPALLAVFALLASAAINLAAGAVTDRPIQRDIS
ncbi:MAG: hypothetical protein NVS9B2_28170 [Steroidobacteraceae bacterium]